MSADLPPKVRDRAAQAAVSEFHEYRKQYGGPNWERIADAVVAVVAPEIARPLQARIEELEAALSELVAIRDKPPSQVIRPSSFEIGRDADRVECAWSTARGLVSGAAEGDAAPRHDSRCITNTDYGRNKQWCDCVAWEWIDEVNRAQQPEGHGTASEAEVEETPDA